MRDYTACYRHRNLVTPRMFHNWGHTMSSFFTLTQKHLRLTPLHDGHVYSVLSSWIYLLATAPLPEAFLSMFRISKAINKVNFKFQLRLCAASLWQRERSAIEEKESAQEAVQIYQASLLLTSPVTKKNKIFSVNELSNNIASADYRWYGTLISRVVAVGLKTPTLLTWPYTARVTDSLLFGDLSTICPCISMVTVT